MNKKNLIIFPFLFILFFWGCSYKKGETGISFTNKGVAKKIVAILDEKRITHSQEYDYSPVWANKGADIIYKSYRGTKKERIYSIKNDGSNKKLLTTSNTESREILCGIDFNDKTKELLFVQEERFINKIIADIWMLNLNSHKKIQFTADFATASYPAWSDDGKTILYVSNKQGNKDIWSIKGEERDMVNLTQNKKKNNQPVLSPDNKSIVYVSIEPDKKISDIWIMESNGTKKRRLTHSSKTGWSYHEPHFSPDGKYITFYANNGKHQNIYIMDKDGDNITALTDGPHADFHPKWSPDGKKITFAREIDNSSSIFVLEVATL